MSSLPICEFGNREFRGCSIRTTESWDDAVYETHTCDDCGEMFTGDPRMEKAPVMDEGNKAWEPAPAVHYHGDPNWEDSCLFVPSAEVRTKQKDGEWDSEIKELQRVRNQSAWIIRQGDTQEARDKARGILSGEFSEVQRARGKAKGCLGIDGAGDFPRRDWFCPPFTRESLFKAAEDLFYSDGIPPRRYWLRSSIDVVPELGQRSDRIHSYTRIAFELLLYLEFKFERPWFLQAWFTQTKLQRHIDRILAQGGPMSREFGNMLGKQHGVLLLDRLPEKVPGFLDNLDELERLGFESGMRARLDKQAKDILRFLLDAGEDDVSWAQLFLDRHCTIRFNEDGEWKPSQFWVIDRSNKCTEGRTMHLTAILIGLAVAQALHEQYPGRPLDREAVLRLVKAETTFTGGDPMRVWNKMMARRGQRPGWV